MKTGTRLSVRLRGLGFAYTRMMEMIKKRTVGAIALGMVVGLGALSATSVHAAPEQLLLGGGGYTSGSWYMGSVAITEIVNKDNKEVNLTAIPGGGVSNAKAVARGRADFAFVYQDIAHAAFNRQEPFTDKLEYGNIRGLISFAPNSLYVVVRDDSEIRSVKDLVGKRVIGGYVGSGYERAFRQLLAVYDLDPKKIEKNGGKYIYVSMNDAVMMMKDGLADAMVALVAPPASYLLDLSTAFKIRALSIEPDMVKRYVERYPGWEAYVAPGGSYGMDASTNTVASWAGLIVNKDVSEDIVYRFTKAINEQSARIAQSHPVFGLYATKSALSGISVPLHPGAERYWREIGVIK